MTKIVAITGKRGSGKDTAAGGLAMMAYGMGYTHMSFADPLREIVKIAYGVTMHEMTDPILKEIPLDRYPFKSPRELLTLLGTEGFRHLIADDTWVQALLRRSKEYKKVVVSDLRFLNEEKAVKEAGGLIIRIINPNRLDTDAVSKHRSETEMDQIVPHFTLMNDGTIEDIRIKTLKLVLDQLGE